MASAATNIGSKYGSSLDTFTKDLKSGVDAVFLKWAEDSIDIMSNIITSKARTGQASTLARSLYPFPKENGIQIKGEDYWEFVDEGVKGVFNKNKAPNSRFSFKNLGVPKEMLNSFKQYIARTGSKGLKKQTLIRKNKKKQADLITKEAMSMAVATKIGGIKPMNYVEPAVGAKRLKMLNKALSKEMAVKIKLAIIK
tara:strand:- start:186 stop:776 length:591 start_codon:yes stop_codon:yes gene_type:complete